MGSFELQIKEFIESMNSDFYLDLNLYESYKDKKFGTKDMTITTILKVCESFVMTKTPFTLTNHIDLSGLIPIAINRIDTNDDIDKRNEALSLVYGLHCYEIYKNKPEILGADLVVVADSETLVINTDGLPLTINEPGTYKISSNITLGTSYNPDEPNIRYVKNRDFI